MSPMLQEEDVYDVLIVGAGPCGLATAARLREHAPDALFTDEEHRRYHWIGKYGNKVSLKNVRSGKKTSAKATRRPEYKMVVLDSSSDAWLGRWKSLFKTFDIQHLRSPMLWHVDPLDRDALLAHAYRTERQDELVEIRHCVGKEISKHAKKKQAAGPRAYGGKQAGRVAINLRDRNDYYTPSQALFCDHCQDVATRYNLGDEIIHKESVEDIDHGVVRGISIDGEKLFTVTTNTMRRYAKVVILAVGPANVPYIPRTPSMAKEGPIEQASAQLADLAIRKGVTKVWLLMRGPLKLKHFDVDLNWMGKYKNAEQSRFWTADTDEERLEIIKEARGGGSVTPTTIKDAKLQKMIEKYPIKTHGGFPCLTEDLSWREDVPLFMAGRLACLQLGPAAPNIGGAKVGAERIAWAVEDLIKPTGADEWEDINKENGMGDYLSGHGNMYSALASE